MKYLVLKIEDINEHLSPKESATVYAMARKVCRGRKESGKKYSNIYYVVNSDDKIADEVKELIKSSQIGCDVDNDCSRESRS